MITFKNFKPSKDLSVREKFYRGTAFKIGQLVEDSSGKYEILDRGTNYITCSDSTGNIVRKFVESVTPVDGYAMDDCVDSFKGFKPTYPSLEIREAFKTTIDKYNNGTVIDAIAILKALKAVSENDMKAVYESISRIQELKEHSYLKEAMDIIKPTDKLKVAIVIADTLGSDSSSGSAESIINLALRTARKNSMMTRGESLKIIERMLDLADKVGIKYDRSIIRSAEAVNEADKTDSVKLDIPLFIRVLELAREDIKSDADLHSMVERMVAMRDSGMLTMDNYKEIARGIVSESLNELSNNTLASYKKKAGEVASAADKAGNFKKADKKFSGIMKATKKQFHNDLKEGCRIQVNHESGRKLYGKLKGKHGSVYEVQYGNGKIGFHHSHKCELLNEKPVNEADEIKTYSDITQAKSTPVDTEQKLADTIKMSAGVNKSAADDLNVKDKNQGASLGATNDTHRHQLLRKLKGLS